MNIECDGLYFMMRYLSHNEIDSVLLYDQQHDLFDYLRVSEVQKSKNNSYPKFIGKFKDLEAKTKFVLRFM